MLKKKFFIATFLIFLFGTNLYATTISFEILERNSLESNVKESSYLIEDALFEYFFDKGIVSSNSLTCVSDSEKKDEQLFRKSLGEARQGSLDYFIEILVFYEKANSSGISSSSSQITNIKKISWKLIDVKSDNLVASGTENPLNKNFADEKIGIYELTKNFADKIFSTILQSTNSKSANLQSANSKSTKRNNG